MKIRTDFVTNSSSYSSAEIMIDNPVLLEILQRYKGKGLFDEISDFEIGTYGKNQKPIEGGPEIPAFYLPDEDEASGYYAPKCLDNVLIIILECIDSEYGFNDEDDFDANLFKMMAEEIKTNNDEIKDGYIQVRWKYGTSYNENFEYPGWINDSASFHYDREHGEDYHQQITASYSYNHNGKKEGDILEETHLVNGEEVE